MLVLYNGNEQNFETLGLGVLKDLKGDALITEALNGSFNLEFDYIKDGWLSEYLVEGNIVKADGQLFRIRSIAKDIKNTKISIFAKHIWFDNELNNWVEDVAPTNKVGHSALTWLLDHAKENNRFTINGDCTKIESARYVRMNPIEAIYTADNALLDRFGGEIEINNYSIFLHNKRGSDTGLQIRQEKNLTGANYHVDISTLATRIMPVGKDGIILPEKYVDSPLINNYYAPFYYKLDVDIGVDEDNGITLNNCYAKMREEAQKLFSNGIDKPNVNITIDFIELSKTKEYSKYSSLETAHLGDTCSVYIPAFNLNLTTRIVKTVKNCSKNRITSIELGTPKINYVNSNTQNQNAIKNTISKMPESILSSAQKNATNLINHPFSGYIYISDDTGELYIMDTNNIATATNIWKFGLGGLGFSSNGINGPYTIAMTQDGKIVADFIAAGTLNASVIQGLTTVNNGLQIDNNGSVILNSARMNNATIVGGNIALVDTGVSSNPSIRIYDENNVHYNEHYLTPGTNMNDVTLKLNFSAYMEPDKASPSLSHSMLAVFTNGSIRYSYGYQYDYTIRIWFHNDLTNEDTTLYERVGDLDTHPSEATINLTSFKLPANVGDILELYFETVADGVYLVNLITYLVQAIEYETSLSSQGISITDNDLTAYYSNHGMHISDQNGACEFSSSGIWWATLFGADYADFRVNKNGVFFKEDNLLKSSKISKLEIITSGNPLYLELALSEEVNGSWAYGVNIWASDKRLKKDIKDSTVNALDVINKIRHISFKYKSNDKYESIGYLADQLEEIDKDLIFEVGENKLKQPSESYIIPLLSKAIQEQQEIIEKLTKRIEVLENEISKRN